MSTSSVRGTPKVGRGSQDRVVGRPRWEARSRGLPLRSPELSGRLGRPGRGEWGVGPSAPSMTPPRRPTRRGGGRAGGDSGGESEPGPGPVGAGPRRSGSGGETGGLGSQDVTGPSSKGPGCCCALGRRAQCRRRTYPPPRPPRPGGVGATPTVPLPLPT